MLTITVPATEMFDEASSEFIEFPEVVLELEHSLVSLSKWESIWKKPFISDDVKSDEETYSYIRCMNLSPEVPPEVFNRLSRSNLEAVTEYINNSMTATWFAEDDSKLSKGGPRRKEVITGEIIYYWMVTMQIPPEYQHWHLNRLITLVRVINQKNAPEKKMSKREIASRNKSLNEARRQQFNTKG